MGGEASVIDVYYSQRRCSPLTQAVLTWLLMRNIMRFCPVNKATFLILTSCIVFLDAVTVFPQIAGGLNETTATRLGGNSYVTGTVFWPSGTPINVRMGIRLKSPAAGEYITTTDNRGQFVFSGLTAGNYTVIIEGEEDFVAVAQQVEVLQSRSQIPQTYAVSIRLTDKAKVSNKPEVVSVSSAAAPKKAADYYKKALELSGEKDHKGAVEQLKLGIAAYPTFLDAYNELGVQYQRLGELAKAEQALIAALKIKPDAFEPMLNRGIVLFRMNRFGEAELVLREVLKVNERSALPHFYLGRALAKLRKYDDAETELNAAISISPDEMKEGHRILAMLYIDKDDRAKAVAALETYLRLVPSPTDAEQLKQALAQLKAAVGKH